ncbi:MAG: Gfo/Idh/MocA family oxidoreductase [Patescibacteria group bacterium]|nr:Gfo/Idh/MocA family oxidoreductase [Patescibacteria group bacterium]MDD5715132.1 Gfo/Idh/MocA family oxidoreductase [Patescibacteria group bacterium]
MQKFAIIGVAGYIAPRHLKAIKDTNNTLVAALDPHDSVGILDSFFPDTQFFTEFERFERHVEKLKREHKGNEVDYVSICSPNYLHDSHVRFALRVGAHAICEKPLVLNPWNVDALADIEKETGKRIYSILQLRVYPVFKHLKKKFQNDKSKVKHNVILTYITSRGSWYHTSWKGQFEKSGGLATNIGIHFFDLLIWLFGNVISVEVHCNTPERICGFLELKHARVTWFLSIDHHNLPSKAIEKHTRTYRSLIIDGQEVEFSESFTDLHTIVYQEILKDRGFSLSDIRPSIALAHEIRTAKQYINTTNIHPLGKRYV